jgi:hypothetical protein
MFDPVPGLTGFCFMLASSSSIFSRSTWPLIVCSGSPFPSDGRLSTLPAASRCSPCRSTSSCYIARGSAASCESSVTRASVRASLVDSSSEFMSYSHWFSFFGRCCYRHETSNQSMKPTAPWQNDHILLATTPWISSRCPATLVRFASSPSRTPAALLFNASRDLSLSR